VCENQSLKSEILSGEVERLCEGHECNRQLVRQKMNKEIS
jgi:hypothetical protein